MPSNVRFRLLRIRDGEWIHQDFPILEPEITFTLSGPTQIEGKLAPENRDLQGIGAYPWGTWVIAEQDGEMLCPPCILLPSPIAGEEQDITAVGVSEYAHKHHFRGTWNLGNPVGVGQDPIDIVRYLWDYIQSDPARDVGVRLGPGSSPVRLGTVEDEEDTESGPYTLDWWESPNIGEEIDKLARDTPFDYRERGRWNEDRSAPIVDLEFAYPRIGRRRFDLRFAQGENIDNVLPIEEDPDLFCTTVIVHGRGEGSEMVHGRADAHHPFTLPITTIIEDKSLSTRAECDRRAADELKRRSQTAESRLEVSELELDMYNANAPFGSFDVGDEILLHISLAWTGELALWHRVTEMTIHPDSGQMTLGLVRCGLELQNFDPGLSSGPVSTVWTLGIPGATELGQTTTLA